MSEQDKQPYAKQDKKKSTVKEKKFEIVYKPYTPYGRLGSWLQFIWRF